MNIFETLWSKKTFNSVLFTLSIIQMVKLDVIRLLFNFSFHVFGYSSSSCYKCYFLETLFNESFIIISGQLTHPGLLFFGKLNDTITKYEVFELPIFILMGVIGGLLGAVFVAINMRLMVFRMK